MEIYKIICIIVIILVSTGLSSFITYVYNNCILDKIDYLTLVCIVCIGTAVIIAAGRLLDS